MDADAYVKGKGARYAMGAALVLYIATLPLLFPNLDFAHRIFVSGSEGARALVSVQDPSFLRALALSALFTALAMLFVCLVKTAYGRMTVRLVGTGAAAWMLGAALVTACGFGWFPFVLVRQVAGVALGFGSAILAMGWMSMIRPMAFRATLRAACGLFLGAVAFDAALVAMPQSVSIAIWCTAALLAGVGSFASWKATNADCASATVPGANWWDVFGRLDVSLVEGTNDLAAPVARASFFVLTPCVMFLLMTLTLDLHHESLSDGFPLEIVGGFLALACALPLLIAKTDRMTVGFAYRIYLPLLAVVLFVAGNFDAVAPRSMVMGVGIMGLCALYSLFMAAVIAVMASRMPSLRLPTACLLAIATGLMALMAYVPVDAGVFNGYKPEAQTVLLLVALVLLAVFPGSRIAALVLDDGSLEAEESEEPSLTLEERCARIVELYGLTRRESEVLALLGRGHGSSYIAQELVVSESTVRSHVKSIYRKTGVSSREEMIALIDGMVARQEGENEVERKDAPRDALVRPTSDFEHDGTEDGLHLQTYQSHERVVR